MDYRKKATAKIAHGLTSPNRRILSKFSVLSFRLLLVVIITTVLLGITTVLGVLRGLIDTAPNIDSIDVSPEGYSTTIYDADGHPTQTLVGQNANRIYVTLDQIPKCVQNAFIAIEDSRFREHNGIDIMGIIRAAANIFQTGDLSQGASTITQQLLKNTVFEGGAENSDVDKIQRKIQEQYLAVQLEAKMNNKDLIQLTSVRIPLEYRLHQKDILAKA